MNDFVISNHSASSVPAGGTKRSEWGFQRNELLLLAFAATAASATIPSARAAIDEFGIFGAVMAAFKISAIVWAAFWLGLSSILSSSTQHAPSSLDKVVCIIAILICFMPVGGALWILMFALGLYVVVTSKKSRDLCTAGWVFMAVTVPEFWGRRMFNFFSDFILEIDARFVSALTATKRIGNIVAMPGGEGSLVIGAPCSSMANVSLAVLCWVLFSRYNLKKWAPLNLFWCGLVCVSIMIINVTRITIIGYYPQYYFFLHDGGGVVIFSWLSAIVAVLVSYIGVRHINAHQN